MAKEQIWRCDGPSCAVVHVSGDGRFPDKWISAKAKLPNGRVLPAPASRATWANFHSPECLLDYLEEAFYGPITVKGDAA